MPNLRPERVSLPVSRSELQTLLQDSTGINSIRLVEVFRANTESQPYPVYRIFGLQPGSAYELLGLKNTDILVAANDYIIRTPQLFVQYVRLLPREPEAFIEIERGGIPLIFAYEMTE